LCRGTEAGREEAEEREREISYLPEEQEADQLQCDEEERAWIDIHFPKGRDSEPSTECHACCEAEHRGCCRTARKIEALAKECGCPEDGRELS